jgi:hypothetical protein
MVNTLQQTISLGWYCIFVFPQSLCRWRKRSGFQPNRIMRPFDDQHFRRACDPHDLTRSE